MGRGQTGPAEVIRFRPAAARELTADVRYLQQALHGTRGPLRGRGRTRPLCDCGVSPRLPLALRAGHSVGEGGALSLPSRLRRRRGEHRHPRSRAREATPRLLATAIDLGSARARSTTDARVHSRSHSRSSRVGARWHGARRGRPRCHRLLGIQAFPRHILRGTGLVERSLRSPSNGGDCRVPHLRA